MAAKIYFDDDCSLCKRLVHQIQMVFRPRDVNFIPAQSNPQILTEMIQRNSWIFETETGERYYRYKGFLKLIERTWLRSLLPLFSLSPVTWIGDHSYQFVANHRPTTCEIPKKIRK